LLTPCEVAVKCALPSVRAMVATELVNKHSLNQAQVAKLLGISQPAISLYQKKLRGNSLDLWGDPDIAASVSKQAELLVNNGLDARSNLQWFCSVCKTLRSKGYLCKIHKDLDPTVDLDTCDFCKNLEPNDIVEELKKNRNQLDL
jgi:predicted transcriptional regulator